MNRKKRLLMNTTMGIMKQVVFVVCGFILPRYILLYYGSEVNGLIASITHFLSFISLLDMGVGSVIQANLYTPLANSDDKRISEICIASRKFFRKLACIFLVYIGALVVILPGQIGSVFDFAYTASLVVIIAISTFMQYFFGVTNELLLNADQKAYIPLSLQIGTLLISTLLAIVLMVSGASIHMVKLLTSIIYIVRPIGQSIYVKHNYTINHKLKIIGDPIQQKWNGFTQHFAAVVCENIDVAILSICSTLSNVSIYSVYYMVTNGVTMIILTAANGLESFFGNMIAKNERSTLWNTFEMVEWLIHTVVTIIFTTAAVLIVPFISIYTEGIPDANYIVPGFGAMLLLAYATQCLRIPYFRIIKAAGHFKQTQKGALISAALNILLSFALVFRFNLLGIAFGTFVAMAYHTCYFVWYLKKNILNRSEKYFISYIITDCLICVLTLALTNQFSLERLSYLSWLVMAVKVGIITLSVSAICNLLFYKKRIAALIRSVKK